MSGTFFVRMMGVVTCMAVVACGWDAEAGWRSRRAACCYTPCCVSSCCTPVCETACVSYAAPCSTCYVRPSCGYVTTVVERAVVVPATSCCAGGTVAVDAVASSDRVSPAAERVAQAAPTPAPAR